MKIRRRGRLAGIGLILMVLAIVEAAVAADLVDAALVPLPTKVVARFAEIILSGKFVQPLAQTLRLLIIGYSMGCILGIAMGLLMGRWRAFYNLFEPLLEMLRPLPKPALLPPLMLFLGLGSAMKITIVALAVFFPVVINTVQGVVGVDRILVDCGRTFGHSPIRVLLHIILPAALPTILTGMRVGLALGLILVVLAEMLAGTGGVGYLIIDMQRSFRMIDMYAWIVLLALFGYLLNAVFVVIERRIMIWRFQRGKSQLGQELRRAIE
jgi:ABC-type nitrate/sulfonate/bicarbonate transport system permease component